MILAYLCFLFSDCPLGVFPCITVKPFFVLCSMKMLQYVSIVTISDCVSACFCVSGQRLRFSITYKNYFSKMSASLESLEKLETSPKMSKPPPTSQCYTLPQRLFCPSNYSPNFHPKVLSLLIITLQKSAKAALFSEQEIDCTKADFSVYFRHERRIVTHHIFTCRYPHYCYNSLLRAYVGNAAQAFTLMEVDYLRKRRQNDR